jgi:hypothetical protein
MNSPETSNIDDFKATLQCFNEEYRGAAVHAQYMRTFSKRISSSRVIPRETPGDPVGGSMTSIVSPGEIKHAILANVFNKKLDSSFTPVEKRIERRRRRKEETPQKSPQETWSPPLTGGQLVLFVSSSLVQDLWLISDAISTFRDRRGVFEDESGHPRGSPRTEHWIHPSTSPSS